MNVYCFSIKKNTENATTLHAIFVYTHIIHMCSQVMVFLKKQGKNFQEKHRTTNHTDLQTNKT